MESHIQQLEVNFVENEVIKRKITVKNLDIYWTFLFLLFSFNQLSFLPFKTNSLMYLLPKSKYCAMRCFFFPRNTGATLLISWKLVSFLNNFYLKILSNIFSQNDFIYVLGLNFLSYYFFLSLKNTMFILNSKWKNTVSRTSERINRYFQIFFTDLKIKNVV